MPSHGKKPLILQRRRRYPLETAGQIAAAVGASEDWAAQVLRTAHVARRIGRPPKPWPAALVRDVRELVAAGATHDVIAGLLGISRSSFSKRYRAEVCTDAERAEPVRRNVAKGERTRLAVLHLAQAGASKEEMIDRAGVGRHRVNALLRELAGVIHDGRRDPPPEPPAGKRLTDTVEPL